jgi:preprotein translocase SecE subunit
MAVHRIKAKDDAPAKKPAQPKAEKPAKAKPEKAVKPSKKDKKLEKAKTKTPKNPNKKVFILFRPFVAFGRYVKGSWHEIRQVRWPNRKLTWKMTLSVIIYVIIFAVVIMLLDALFAFLFNQLLGV